MVLFAYKMLFIILTLNLIFKKL